VRANLPLIVLIAALSAPTGAQAYSLTRWSWNEAVTLKLVDGRAIEGRYRGVFGRTSDPATYASRYGTWRAALGAVAPPALGETLLVTRAPGESVRGPLRGFADRALLLGTDDSCICIVMPLDKHAQVRRVGVADAAGPAEHRRWKSAPSLYAVSLQVDGASMAVPVSMIASRSMLPAANSNPGATALVGVLVVVVLVTGAAIAAAASAFDHPLI
jgi:hypothetical protein